MFAISTQCQCLDGLRFTQDILPFAAVLTGLLTAFAGVHQLRAIAKANYLQAFESFAQRWEESKDDRWRVLESFTFDLSNPPSSDSDESQVLRRVVNSVNIAGLLVEQKLVPAQAILTLCYPDFIRLEKVLDGYLKYRSKQLGINYGQRIRRMSERAKRYHDIKHPNEIIRARINGGSYRQIYHTKSPSSFFGWVRSKIVNTFVKLFGLY